MARQPAKKNKVSITRRINADLWQQVLEYAQSFPLQVTDTAIIEAALRDYLQRNWKPNQKHSEKS